MLNLSTLKLQARKGDGCSAYYQCPECMGHKKLEINSKTGQYFCHKCGEGGVLKSRRKVQEHEEEAAPWDCHPLSNPWNIKEVQHPASTYLTRVRGVGKQEWAWLQPHRGPSLCRCYLPILMPGGTVPVSWQARALFDGMSPKYLNPPTTPTSPRQHQLVWGLHRLVEPLSMLVVCEGIFDALWEKNRVAILGKSISKEQILLISKWVTDEIVVMLDGTAHEEASIVAKTLSQRWTGRISIAYLPDWKDPDTVSVSGCGKAIRERSRVV